MELSPFLFGLYKLIKFMIYPFTWLCLLLGALTLMLYLSSASRSLRWGRILAVSACLLVFVLGSPIVSETVVGLLEQTAPPFDQSAPKHFDAVVVLAGGILPKGSLRPTHELTELAMHRTICGADLFQQGWAPRLLLAGGDAMVFGEGPKESIEMKKLATRLGVPANAIVVETRSRTTYESAVETKQILGDATVIVVTSAHHIPRALALFRKQGLEPIGYPCGYMARNRPGDVWDGNPFALIPTVWALSESTRAVSELVGTVAYWAAGKL